MSARSMLSWSDQSEKIDTQSIHASPCLPGNGILKITSNHSSIKHADLQHRISFPIIQYKYPLKLLISRAFYNRNHNTQIGVVHILNYGGGLVHGDHLSIEIYLESHCQLLCLSQGSTKVFKNSLLSAKSHHLNQESLYPNSSQKNSIGLADSTKQTIYSKIGSHSTLLMLPSYVTCFRDSNFIQKQSFHLQDLTSSLVCLDWFTSGRSSSTRLHHQHPYKESWSFQKYHSFIEIFIASNRIIRDNLIQTPTTILKNKPFQVYVNLFLISSSSHPVLMNLFNYLSNLNKSLSNQTFKNNNPTRNRSQTEKLLWSFSELDCSPDFLSSANLISTSSSQISSSIRIAVIRIGAETSILIRDWLQYNLSSLKDLIGPELFKNCF
ncbi:hypothetical protein O181_075903 [Austropuccinia psidii MF-1]|uniref:Urease accessory protein UreD n=1 Tax=Austropuccinia psidii MF-1 TaxID=1389203 RepID=A0A9Q3FDX4_9BASI|nr:hypothetical protein [Austropuccinia psidii MF-1]